MTQPESLHRRIAARVRELRAARGWSAARLAEEMAAAGTRWDRSIVANFENGRRAYVTAEELVALAGVLGTSPHLLLLASDADPETTAAVIVDQLLSGPFHFEVNRDTTGALSWAKSGAQPAPKLPVTDPAFDDAVRAAGDGER
ncbi:helix-turn-helix domain-containing protein [Phytohabitans kaempferiae]|uniref:Helix-turn-helix domain-containing protein n=1 Tax=Phytohabitans kaempferiae TaxID=1620943 RepID=A0ABV6M002_9ACTN